MLGRIKAALGLLITLAVVGGRAFGQAPPDGLSVKYSHVTGMASLVTASDGGAIPLKGAKAGVADKSADFLNQYGDLFGITNPSAELTQVKVEKDTVLGYQSTKYEQKFNGVKVFGGVLKVHQNKGGKIVAANGNFYPIPEGFSTTPVLNKTAAEALAIGLVTGLTPSVEKSELVIIDQGWYGGTSSGPHLAYYILLRDQAHAFRRGFFVDAMTGQALEQWNMMFDVKNRTVYSAQETLTTNTLVLRTEGDPPSGDADGDKVYAFAGDVYDYYFRAFGRDSIDGQSLPMDLIVHINGGGFCPNAFWDGRHMNFCTGVVSDDVTAHELTHGVTDHEGGPGVDFYFYQPGQLNESLSDIFGELVDLFNGNAAFPGSPTGPPFWPPNEAGISGLDTPNNLRTNQCSKGPSFPDGIRWLMGEDLTAFGPDRAIRDMWDPTCFCNPDRAGSPLLFVDCAEPHNGSGVLNHGFALMTDGGVFNGQTITGVGPIKSGAIIYRALTLYLTELSDFIDAYNAINQAAQDLIGTFPNDPRTGLPSTSMFTAFDAQQVDKALISVEMNTPGACGSLHAATPCPTPDKNKDLELYSPNEEAGGGFGRSVSGIPNTAGDGLGDLVIGAFQENSGVSPQNAGKAYIFNGLFNTVPLALT
ncbi:M4 family metallopeptidase, partial [Candidatus Sumerlaeota bacterium]|nr:M4 family metallopeptidase [Candidatus Sumerlaeota bacterium]